MDEDWLTVVDAAFRMQKAGSTIPLRTISKYRDSGRIPSQDQDGIGLVRISDILAYEAEHGINRDCPTIAGSSNPDALLSEQEL